MKMSNAVYSTGNHTHTPDRSWRTGRHWLHQSSPSPRLQAQAFSLQLAGEAFVSGPKLMEGGQYICHSRVIAVVKLSRTNQTFQLSLAKHLTFIVLLIG